MSTPAAIVSTTRRAIRSAFALLALVLLLPAAASAQIGFQPQPVAVATFTDFLGPAPLTVTFDGSGSYGLEGSIPTTWHWDFGDGSTGTGTVVTHTFTIPGTKVVTLTVTDQFGNTDQTTVSGYVVAFPVVTMTASPTTGLGPLTVSFTASAVLGPERTLSSMTWDFGDGTTASGASVSHTFGVGQYVVRVSVRDDLGYGGSADQIIVVTEPMLPPTNLTATAPRRGPVTLSWTNRMSNAGVHHMEIERCSGNKCTNFAFLSFANPGDTRFTDPVTKGTFRYRIKVVDHALQFGYSNIATVSVR